MERRGPSFFPPAHVLHRLPHPIAHSHPATQEKPRSPASHPRRQVEVLRIAQPESNASLRLVRVAGGKHRRALHRLPADLREAGAGQQRDAAARRGADQRVHEPGGVVVDRALEARVVGRGVGGALGVEHEGAARHVLRLPVRDVVVHDVAQRVRVAHVDVARFQPADVGEVGPAAQGGRGATRWGAIRVVDGFLRGLRQDRDDGAVRGGDPDGVARGVVGSWNVADPGLGVLWFSRVSFALWVCVVLG